MYSFVEKVRRRRAGFTLVELLVVIVVLAVLAAMVLPKFMDSSRRSKESALKSDLTLLRDAVSRMQTDTGAYPAQLADLITCPSGLKGFDSGGNQLAFVAGDWHGPYLNMTAVPNDPVAAAAFTYSVATGSVGKVSSSATGNGLDGTAYSTW